jgi:hypothetical protein
LWLAAVEAEVTQEEEAVPEAVLVDCFLGMQESHLVLLTL